MIGKFLNLMTEGIGSAVIGERKIGMDAFYLKVQSTVMNDTDVLPRLKSLLTRKWIGDNFDHFESVFPEVRPVGLIVA
ncbi:Acyl-CoA dehydrogenase related to the alkylation response protein AidB [Pseudomonas syringae pv. actinidiae]|uniref:Acyl-CoA dehydrogenase related to the alkylation response protein AidB n=1 Tax=Pseudomonas syringae pv. actinidiae TaxID=103796 RepID=A0A2V0QIK1_PSESF|nr:Acyl-CoA dehydrogenase related to the alkylation response protein AidB [Pseudomonas syringae pv. actinidiae]